MESLRSLKERDGTDKPYVNINFVAWKDNIEELPGVVKIAAAFGVRGVYVVHRIFYHKNDFEKFSLCRHKKLYDKYLQQALDLAHKLKIQMVHSGDFSRNIPQSVGLQEAYFNKRLSGVLVCKVADEQTTIGYNGLIRACCFIDKLFMGNMNIDTFENIWNGPLYRKLRLDLYSGNNPDGCRNCPYFQILKRVEDACYYPINLKDYISASLPITQPYNITRINEEFQKIIGDVYEGCLTADDAIERLVCLWHIDNNFFEIANNIAVIYAFRSDMRNAKMWISKAKDIIAGEDIVEHNYNFLH